MLALKFVLLVIGAYFLGNVNFARIFAAFKKKDITKQGSGNPGTMNMLRTFGLGMAVLTLCFEALKGIIPALIGFYLLGPEGLEYAGLYAGGLAVVLGHNFPVIYKFKGGKGVACLLGVFLVANPMWAAIAFACGLLYIILFDYGAVASFTFLIIMTIEEIVRFYTNIPVTCIIAVMFLLTLFMHRQNIKRLFLGKENRAHFLGGIKKLNNHRKAKKETETAEVIVEGESNRDKNAEEVTVIIEDENKNHK